VLTKLLPIGWNNGMMEYWNNGFDPAIFHYTFPRPSGERVGVRGMSFMEGGYI
jgi:hypothetical protein